MFPLANNNPWSEGIKIVSRCPLCRCTEQELETKIVGQDGQTRLLHLNCHQCGNSLLALVLVSGAGISSIGMLTDLTFEDTVRFKCTRLVSEDDILDVHHALAESDFLQQL